MHRGNRVITLFVYQLFDLAVIATALFCLYAFSVSHRMASFETFLTARITVRNGLLCFCFLIFWHAACAALKLYDPNNIRASRAVPRAAAAAGIAAIGALAFPMLSKSGLFSYALVFWFWVTTTAAMVVMRLAMGALRKLASPVPHVVIVGTGPLAQKALSELEAGSEDVVIVGYLDCRDQKAASAWARDAFIGHIDELDRILMRQVIDHVVIALPARSCYLGIQQTIETCVRVGVPASMSVDLFGFQRAHSVLGHVSDNRSQVHIAVAADDERLVVKRLLDIAIASTALLFLAPLMLTIAILIKLQSNGPVFFVQERYGLHKRRFRMLKFRTMVVDAEALQAKYEANNEAQGPVFKIRNDPRMTGIGPVLRRTSLDELPQFINVLAGNMSLVGPRPLPARDVLRFEEPWLMRRFSVKPGLTCLWQINGRSDVGFDKWIRLDLEYIDNWSLALDLRILALTVPAVIRGAGAA